MTKSFTTSNQSSRSIQSLSLTAVKAPSRKQLYVDICISLVCMLGVYEYMYVFSYAYSAGYSKRKLSVCHIIHMCNFNLRLMNTRNEAHPNTYSNLNSNSQFNFNCHRFGGDWWQFKQLRRNLCYTICAMTTNTHEVFRFAKLFL